MWTPTHQNVIENDDVQCEMRNALVISLYDMKAHLNPMFVKTHVEV